MATTPAAPTGRKWLRPAEAANYLGVPSGTLKTWRARRIGPPYSAPNRRCVRYAVDALDAWLASAAVDTVPRTSRSAS